MIFAVGREIIRGMGGPDETRAGSGPGKALRRFGWVAVAFFTLKGLLWLALAAGAWKLFS